MFWIRFECRDCLDPGGRASLLEIVFIQTIKQGFCYSSPSGVCRLARIGKQANEADGKFN